MNIRKMADSGNDFLAETDSPLGLGESGKPIPSSPRVLSILSSVFERSIQKNEKLLKKLKTKDNVTVFHGSRAPTMGIGQYIDRISKYTCCGTPCLVVAYIYIERYLQKMDAYLTSLNVHRLLITSIMVAAKFNDAGCHNNTFFARVGGVSTKEMNRMEIEFLSNLDFRLHVTADIFRAHCLQLQKEGFGENPINHRPSNKTRAKCLPQIAGYTCRAV
ncbi:cyclin-P3-1-like [Cucurbita maxima]|uniref:Cyclin-P3-1-like n=1 Tax=Cucurbita maxima TaxID=3661 RepID=A0A6J1HQ42_CUCMA|nr:cyclin-P3-1-like [Cucurbita maxima]XP_022965919.1 cyclin-P3-1-like [Cucurbita maxima]XP_022965920.1 cyclin-P3-1-like [Cucurbita maxima]XP_022965921.1 cyclin-P3-1-like [Cucurbita maxima]XP_022965922.1 cyclin-P3-1-like [Cucurbita maxima]XP_022965923.1 cyclin-P3-1-like [Cucurbita maxima]XP_022965924.1 cyclin-P3-1-like [Cucurbita maxima]XP_022965925.1 cyclin-P3-1-like [Cucurbita maxima]